MLDTYLDSVLTFFLWVGFDRRWADKLEDDAVDVEVPTETEAENSGEIYGKSWNVSS